MFKVRDYTQALGRYNRAIQLDPSDAEAYNNRAAVHSQSKDWNSCEADCSRALRLKPEYTKARIRRANALLQLGQPAAALEDALMVSNNEPGHIDALRLEERARQQLASMTTRLAVEEAELPDSPHTTGSGHFDSGDTPAAAIETAHLQPQDDECAHEISEDEKLPIDPPHLAEATQVAQETEEKVLALMAASDFPGASSLLAEALKSGACKPSMHLQLAECYLKMEQYEFAVYQAKLATIMGGDVSKMSAAFRCLASARLALGDLPGAKTSLERVKTCYTSDAIKAQCDEEIEQIDQQQKAIEQQARAKPEREGVSRYGSVEIEELDEADAPEQGGQLRVKGILQRAQSEAVANHQRDYRARHLNEQRNVLWQQITSRNAQRAARRAACQARLEKLKQEGNDLFHSGKHAEAEQIYSRCLERQPGFWQAHSNRCTARMKLGDFWGAIEDATAVLEAQPSNLRVLRRRAAAKKAIGDEAGALQDEEQLVELERAAMSQSASVDQAGSQMVSHSGPESSTPQPRAAIGSNQSPQQQPITAAFTASVPGTTDVHSAPAGTSHTQPASREDQAQPGPSQTASTSEAGLAADELIARPSHTGSAQAKAIPADAPLVNQAADPGVATSKGGAADAELPAPSVDELAAALGHHTCDAAKENNPLQANMPAQPQPEPQTQATNDSSSSLCASRTLTLPCEPPIAAKKLVALLEAPAVAGGQNGHIAAEAASVREKLEGCEVSVHEASATPVEAALDAKAAEPPGRASTPVGPSATSPAAQPPVSASEQSAVAQHPGQSGLKGQADKGDADTVHGGQQASDRPVSARMKELSVREREDGNTRFKSGDLAGALACYSRACNADPESALAFGNRALVHLKLGNPSEAFTDCSRVTDSILGSLLS
ncbi:hypothetical protein WJX84_005538 [Apatococcus fuscideae]|uniref:Uncharacterized protein n=1 Tax=Apatococcus fuscideae TaxID=2026836 RepID=A0AAW1SM73_9CHLO